MNCAWKRMKAGILLVALVLSLLPLAGEIALAESLGKTTATGVRLRKAPSTSAEYSFRRIMSALIRRQRRMRPASPGTR